VLVIAFRTHSGPRFRWCRDLHDASSPERSACSQSRGLEEAGNLNAVVFDKTGTLTKGEFGSSTSRPPTPASDDALRFAAAVEADSEHTIAQGIVRGAQNAVSTFHARRVLRAIPGKGAKARVDGRSSTSAARPLLRRARSSYRPRCASGGSCCASAPGIDLPRGRTEACLRCSLWRMWFVRNRRKPFALFNDRNLEVVMNDGDARPVAEAVAAELD